VIFLQIYWRFMIAVFDVLPPAFGSSALGPDLAVFVPVGYGEVDGLDDPVGLPDPFPDFAVSSLAALVDDTSTLTLAGLEEIVELDPFPCFPPGIPPSFPALVSFNTLVCSCCCAATSPRITAINTIDD
jgi:hypothetical protein